MSILSHSGGDICYNDDDDNVKCLFTVMMIMMRRARGSNPMTNDDIEEEGTRRKDEVSRESITCNSSFITVVISWRARLSSICTLIMTGDMMTTIVNND